MNEITLKGSFNDEPLIINITQPIVNTTQVTIALGYPSKRYSKSEHKEDTKRIFGGWALCHPNDKFDILLGAKVACRNALKIGITEYWEPEGMKDRNRAIYRACRTLIAQRKLHDAIEKTVNEA